jgi:hypothetical protein
MSGPSITDGSVASISAGGNLVADEVPEIRPLTVMERTGIEPVTSGLQSRRSPS